LFEQILMDISTPSHPRYGQHLKREELKELIKPHASSTDAVLDWLKESGVAADDIENDGEWVNFVAPVSTAEKMMATEFKTYQSLVRPDVKKIRTLYYSVPATVRDHIDLIQPTTRFGQMRPQRSQVHDIRIMDTLAPASGGPVNETCNSRITPDCLKNLYNFADFKADPKAHTLIGVSGFLEQYARFKDYAKFVSLFAPSAVGSNFTWTSVNGMPSSTFCPVRC
jgi:tripeptidyl-peptidase-1